MQYTTGGDQAAVAFIMTLIALGFVSTQASASQGTFLNCWLKLNGKSVSSESALLTKGKMTKLQGSSEQIAFTGTYFPELNQILLSMKDQSTGLAITTSTSVSDPIGLIVDSQKSSEQQRSIELSCHISKDQIDDLGN